MRNKFQKFLPWERAELAKRKRKRRRRAAMDGACKSWRCFDLLLKHKDKTSLEVLSQVAHENKIQPRQTNIYIKIDMREKRKEK